MTVYGNPEVMGIGIYNGFNSPLNRADSVPVPNSGADVSPLGFNAEATLIKGGGYARNSWASHKTYNFSWGDSASLELGALLRGYRSGTYGRGLVVFSDPMYYRTNLAPSFYADPSMSNNFEGPPLLKIAHEVEYPQTPSNDLNLPVLGARYTAMETTTAANITSFPIAIPPRHAFGFGVIADVEQGGLQVLGGGLGPGTSSEGGFSLAPLPTSGPDVVSAVYRNGPESAMPFIYLLPSADFIGTIYGITIRIALPGEPMDRSGPWMPGEGNSGCRFVGDPTIINYNGVGGGQLGISANFKETGAWE